MSDSAENPTDFPLQLAPDENGVFSRPCTTAIRPDSSSRCSISCETTDTAAPLLGAQVRQPPLDRLPRRGLQVLEGELLKLGGDPVHADGARQRRVDVQRLARDPLALLGFLMK
jgi:hypothetical protein